MATMNISVPDPMKEWVKEQIQAGIIAGLDQVERGEFASGSGEEAIERAFERAVQKHNP